MEGDPRGDPIGDAKGDPIGDPIGDPADDPRPFLDLLLGFFSKAAAASSFYLAYSAISYVDRFLSRSRKPLALSMAEETQISLRISLMPFSGMWYFCVKK